MSDSAPEPSSSQVNPSTPATAPEAAAVLNAVCAAVLLILGFVAAVVLGVAAAWLSWLWTSGGASVPLAGASVAGLVALLFAGGRAAGWALGSRLGPWLLTAGWVAGVCLVVGYGSAGDVVMLGAGINYAFLFGSVTALALAAMLSEPVPPRAR